MRTLLFRTPIITVPITTLTNIFTKDMDGASPFILYVENLDQPAELLVSDQWGSPNSKILYKAVVAGAAGNSKRIQVLQHATDKRFLGVVVNVNDVTYTIGSAILAWELVNFSIAQSNPGGIMLELSTPVAGGYATPGLVAALTNLAGGFDSTVTGVTVTEQAQNGSPWISVLGSDMGVAGAIDLDAWPATIVADTMVARYFHNPMKMFRLNVTGGVAATRIRATAVVMKDPK